MRQILVITKNCFETRIEICRHDSILKSNTMKSKFATILILYLSNLTFGMTTEMNVSERRQFQRKINVPHLYGSSHLSDNTQITIYSKQTNRHSDEVSETTPQPASGYFRIRSRITSLKKIYLTLRVMNEKRRHFKKYKRHIEATREINPSPDRTTSCMITLIIH